MAISQNFPNTPPALLLDFAKSKKLDSRITFTRGSTGTYVDDNGLIRTAGINEARFDHDPNTLKSLGLLIEEGRTNLLLRSEEFENNAVWGTDNSGLTITANSVISPDGTQDAETLVEANTNTVHNRYQGVGLVSTSNTYTFSVFIKPNTVTRVQLGFGFAGIGGGGWAKFDLSAGTVISTTASAVNPGTNLSASIISYPNGWYRCIFTVTPSRNDLTYFASVLLLNSSNNETYQGNTANNLYAWGAQLEAGSFPTSYIPTVASTVTRSADNASITGTNFSSWYNQTEGTIFVNTRILGYSSGEFPRPFGFVEFADQFNDFWQFVYNGSTGAIFTETRVNGATPLSVTNFTLAANTNVKIANAVKNGEGQFTSFNGQSIVSNASSSLSSTINSVVFNYANHNGIISQLIYYPRRLSNTYLQELTR